MHRPGGPLSTPRERRLFAARHNLLEWVKVAGIFFLVWLLLTIVMS